LFVTKLALIALYYKCKQFTVNTHFYLIVTSHFNLELIPIKCINKSKNNTLYNLTVCKCRIYNELTTH